MPGLPLRPPGGTTGGNVIIPGGGTGGGGTVILKEPGSYAAGGNAGRNSLVGRSGNKMLPFLRRRRFPDQPSLNAAPFQNYPTNPYADIDAFREYTPSFLQGRDRTIAAQQHLASQSDPWAGYPSHERAQQMSDALTLWSGRSLNPLRSRGGSGLDVGDPTDMLKRLLRERYAGGM